MKKFIFKSCYLLLPFLLIGIYLEYKLQEYPSLYTIKKNQLTKQAKDIKILILGSSYAADAFNPLVFSEHAFNLAMPSQSLYYDKALLDKYINQLPNLHTVIINVAYFSLWYELKRDDRSYFYYTKFRLSNPSISVLDCKAWSIIMLYSPKKAYEIVCRDFQPESNLDFKYHESGWISMDTTSHQFDSLLLLKNAKLRQPGMKESFLKPNIGYLQEMITLLQQRKIKVILMQTPIYQDLSKFQVAKYRQMNDSVLKVIINKYKIPYYDYETKHPYKRIDFYDPDHLSYIGAEKFSKLVDSLVQIHK
jgi:hypothetical protein